MGISEGLSVSGSKMHVKTKDTARVQTEGWGWEGQLAVENAGVAKMKSVELPTQHRAGLE